MDRAVRHHGVHRPPHLTSESTLQRESDLVLRARALGLLFTAGATIGILSLLLPHPAVADMAGLYSNVALAYLGGAGLLLAARHVRTWMIHGALVVGTLLITRAVILSHDPVSFYSVWFIWVALYSFYFLRRAPATAYILLAAGLYALTLAHQPPTSAVARWLTTFTTLVVAGGFIDTLVNRARRDAKRAAATAARMEEVTSLALDLAALSDPVAARATLRERAAALTGAETAMLWIPDSEAAALLGEAPSGEELSLALPAATENARGAARAFLTGHAVWSAGEARDLVPELSAGAAKSATCLYQPVGEAGSVVGVLALRWLDRGHGDDPALVAMCELIATQAKVTLERLSLLARLERVARTDELTGLPNRRAWQEALPRELQRAERSGEPVCVAVLDLDHFKRYNDAHGHPSGDALLREVTSCWMKELRAADILARYGGEEFALLLPGCELHQAHGVVERLRTRMPRGESCSAGIAVWERAESAVELLERADRALYDAKRSGRDRTVAAGPDALAARAGAARGAAAA